MSHVVIYIALVDEVRRGELTRAILIANTNALDTNGEAAELYAVCFVGVYATPRSYSGVFVCSRLGLLSTNTADVSLQAGEQQNIKGYGKGCSCLPWHREHVTV